MSHGRWRQSLQLSARGVICVRRVNTEVEAARGRQQRAVRAEPENIQNSESRARGSETGSLPPQFPRQLIHSLVQVFGVLPGGFGFSHAVTVAAPPEGVLYGKRGLLSSQAHCGHAPATLGSHQSQETLRSPGWLRPPLLRLQESRRRSHERRCRAGLAQKKKLTKK